MKRIIPCVLILLALIATAAIGEEMTMFTCSVSKADAILIQCGGHAVLVDSGYAYSRGRILYGMEQMGIDSIDAVFLTHTDSDHTGGLKWIAESDIPVGAWYMSGMYTGVKEKKHPLINAAEARGDDAIPLSAGDHITIGEMEFEVLAPSIRAEDKDNNNSLVMRVRNGTGSILLCGDMEYPEEAILMNSAADLTADVLKVANHAGDDTGSEAFLRAVSAGTAIISTSSYEKPDTPDPDLVRRLEETGAAVYITDHCTGGIRTVIGESGIVTEYVDAPAVNEHLIIAEVSAVDETITLMNTGRADIDMGGMYLYTDRGRKMFIFPEDTVIAAGGEIIVGCRSTEAEYDLTWDEKKIIGKKKSGTFYLFDSRGSLLDYEEG